MPKTYLICVVASCVALLSLSAPAENRIVVSSEFCGSTPCGAVARQFLGIPADPNCIRITWKLKLEDEDAQRNPRRCELVARCGLLVPGRPGVVEDAKDDIKIQGTWRTTRGTKADPQAVVYELETDEAKRTTAFVKIGDDVLHLLDKERRAMPGNSAWSYGLSRKGKEH
jgi:hypothetical protein